MTASVLWLQSVCTAYCTCFIAPTAVTCHALNLQFITLSSCCAVKQGLYTLHWHLATPKHLGATDNHSTRQSNACRNAQSRMKTRARSAHIKDMLPDRRPGAERKMKPLPQLEAFQASCRHLHWCSKHLMWLNHMQQSQRHAGG